MSTVLLSGLLVAVVIVATPVSERVRVPLPVLLTICGLAIPLLPGTPHLQIEPDLILPIVLPPLLFAATQRATAREFRDNARPILVLAVGLTVATTAAVAVMAHVLGLGWGAAFVLGAVVAPPDPVAATAVARRLHLPGRLVTVLEGEGMFNDATALVIYGVAVTAVVSQDITALDVAWRLVLAVVVGVLVGLALGYLAKVALAALHDGAAETTVTVAVPFVAYLLAEEVHGSGVLAVLTLGLFLRSYAHPAVTSQGWLLGRAVWRYADYLITSLVFVLIGFELTDVLERAPLIADTWRLLGVVALTLVVVRFAWMFPAVAAGRALQRRRAEALPYGPRETAVAAWAGMRGVVTVATALALPTVVDGGGRFVDRPQIVVVGLGCVLITLVLQGLTLSPLVKALGVGEDADIAREVVRLRRRAAQAALDAVRDGSPDDEGLDPVHRAVMLQYEGYLAAQEALHTARGSDAEPAASAAQSAELARVLREASEVERALVVSARNRGEVSSEVADAVLTDVEARAVRDLD